MIAKLRALLAAATPGKWRVTDHRGIEWDDGDLVALVNLAMAPVPAATLAALIVAAHNALPALLDCVEAADAMREFRPVDGRDEARKAYDAARAALKDAP